MTPDQQRTALALACTERLRQVHGRWQYFDGTYWFNCKQNDPLNDLNAMHEAEKVLAPEQVETYWLELWLVVKPQDSVVINSKAIKYLASATASQRAEAFLRTLNLYTSTTRAAGRSATP
jgi:hypothetical protein